MKSKEISIATARISGLDKTAFYSWERCYFAWNIMFFDTSTTLFSNLAFIKVGDNHEEARDFCNQIKNNFKQAYIHDGDKVAVIFDEHGYVRAIGCIGKDLWIDVDDKFVAKTFKELNIKINSLKVH